MTVWITRTRPGAEATAARLAELGLDSLIDPVLEVRVLPTQVCLDGVDALAFTSRNGAAAFAALSDDRSLPAYAVGEATAQALRALGFGTIRTAGGDAEALATLLAEARPGRVLHAAPTEPAADLAVMARGSGVEVRALAVYETRPRRPEAALAARGLSAVLIHSAKGAEGVRRQAAERLADLHVLAISAAAAAPLAGCSMKSLCIAPFPDDPSLSKLTAQTLSDAQP